MKCLLQRVTQANVQINKEIISSIQKGLLVFAAIENNDNDAKVLRMAQRIINYRMFSDAENLLNLSLIEKNYEILIVPQFTLAADTNKGLRPSFTKVAPAKLSENLFNTFVICCKEETKKVQTGRFGEDMQISLINDGPITFLLEV